MTLINLIDTLKSIAKLQPNIRTATDGSIYEVLNANVGVEYGVFHITQTSHVNSNGFDTYGLNLFIVDRLMDDESNRILIQSKAKDGLTNIINTFCEDYMADHEDIIFQPFTDRFKDYCAGVYCSVRIQIAEDSSCTLDYENNEYKPNILILNNQNITIRENGIYYPDEGFTGFGKVNVDIPIEGYMYRRYNENGVYMIEPNTGYAGVNSLEVDVDVPIEGEKFVDINGNGNYDIEVAEGFAGQGDVHLNVDIPIEGEKYVDINENGNYDIEVAEGFTGQGDVHLNVNVPVPIVQDEKNVVLNAGASGKILPDEGFDAMAKVSYSINKTEKMVIPNGITFSGSTFTEFDGSKYDWSMVYDCFQMFERCSNLTTITGMDGLKPLATDCMFRSCRKLDISFLSNLDVSKVYSMTNMFESCAFETTDFLSGWNTSNVRTMESMFRSANIKDISGLSNWDVSNVENMSNMFYGNTTFKNDYSSIVFPNWNTSNLKYLSDMFNGSIYIKNVDFSNLDLSNVVNMSNLFNRNTRLVSVKFGGDINPDVNTDGMFAMIYSSGTLYYPSNGKNYTKIINALPSSWTAVAY